MEVIHSEVEVISRGRVEGSQLPEEVRNMSDPLDATTPSGNETSPEAGAPEDPAQLQSAESLDEDEMAVDPLESGIDPPEQWSAVAARRPTPREQREGETLDEQLAEEVPDVSAENPRDKPVSSSGIHELDDTVDERAEAEAEDFGEMPSTD